MANNDQAGARDAAAAMADVQLTMAQAQRAMAEALLALSTGQTGGAARSAPAAGPDINVFSHGGVLEYNDALELYLADDPASPPESPLTLACLAAGNKRIQLEFQLQADVVTQRSGHDQALVDALAVFLKNYASAVIPMNAECNKSPVTPKPGPKAPPSPSPSPTPAPAPAPAPVPTPRPDPKTPPPTQA